MTREKYNGRTPEAMQKYNEKLTARHLTRLINANYGKNDYFISLTYNREERPNPETAAAQLTAFLRALKRLYKKNGAELKYIRVTAYGSKGAIHHHIIINNIGIDISKITALWRYSVRSPYYKPLYNTGEYSALANYLIKQTKNYGADEIKGKRYSVSRNLIQPEIIKDKYINKIKWKEPPKAKAGYYIDTDSIEAGIDEKNGKPYLFYRMIKIPINERRGESGKEWIKQIEEQNRQYIKQNWERFSPYGNVIKKHINNRT